MTETGISRVASPTIPGIADSVRASRDELIFVSGAVALPEGDAFADFADGVEAVLAELDRALDDGLDAREREGRVARDDPRGWSDDRRKGGTSSRRGLGLRSLG